MKLSLKSKNIAFFSEKLVITIISVLIGSVFVPGQAYMPEHFREFLNLPQTSLIDSILN